jgi:hypothetical protein
MKPWYLRCILLVFSLALSSSAQTQEPKPAADAFENAHEGIFQKKTDRAVEAGRTTAGFQQAGTVVPGNVPRRNFIDEQIFGRMERDGVSHAPLAGDEEFIRRAFIDATGLLPPPEKVREFLAGKDPQKRDKLIDSLVGTQDFAEQWTWFWMDLLQSRIESFGFWLRTALKLDRPWNEVVSDIIAPGATKSQTTIPELGAYEMPLYNNLSAQTLSDKDNYRLMNRLDLIDEASVNISRIFLGLNIECISCHDGARHTDTVNLFLTEKKRSEFAAQAAFFGKWRWLGDGMLFFNVFADDEARGYTTGNDAPYATAAAARFPRDGKTHEPSFILTGEKPRPGQNPRKELARILTSDFQFSRATVNLVWARLMTVGFVEPYDGFDMNRLDPNKPLPKGWNVQPTNPWLLDALAKDFQEHNYSMHHLFKTIMRSSAYQLSTRFPGEWKDQYAPYYARRYVRVLSGPEVADVLAQATGRPYNFTNSGETAQRVKQTTSPSPRGVRGGTNPDPLAVRAIMQAFAQSTRETPMVLANNASAVQAMLMMSSPAVTDRVQAKGGGSVQRLVESGKSDAEAVEELFLRTLSRFPKPEEIEVAQRILNERTSKLPYVTVGDRIQALEDMQWALLNTAEFLLNH